LAKGLIISMLHPDPSCRITVSEAMQHPLYAATPLSSSLPVTSFLQNHCDVHSNITRSGSSIKSNSCKKSVSSTESSIINSSSLSKTKQNECMATMEQPIENTQRILESENDENELKMDITKDNIEDCDIFRMEEEGDVEDNIVSSDNTNGDIEIETKMLNVKLFRENSLDQFASNRCESPDITTDSTKTMFEMSPLREKEDTTRRSWEEDVTRAGRRNSKPPEINPDELLTLPTTGIVDLITTDPSGTMADELFFPSKKSNLQNTAAVSSMEYENHQVSRPLLQRGTSANSASSTISNSTLPPFNDLVKRSTRFITAVPANEVMEKLYSILQDVRLQKTITPIGYIQRVGVDWEHFKLEIWGTHNTTVSDHTYHHPYNNQHHLDNHHIHNISHHSNTDSVIAVTIQLYQWTVSNSLSTSPAATSVGHGFAADESPSGYNQQLHLVEFTRGQLEIFSYKRFYQWLRQCLSEMVKRDYSVRQFDQAVSPMVDSYLLQACQQHM